jgi:hypothetical protein
MRAPVSDRGRVAADGRAAALVARDLAIVSPHAPLGGLAIEHGAAVVRAAVATLDALADRGWRAVVGDGVGAGRDASHALGGDAVAERTESFDPFESLG